MKNFFHLLRSSIYHTIQGWVNVLGMTLNYIWWWGSNPGDHRMWSTLSLPLLQDPLWPGVVELVRILFMGQIEIFNHFLYLKPFNCANKWIISNKIISVKYKYLKPFYCMLIKLLVLDSNSWYHLTLCQQMSSVLFNNATYKLYFYKS